MRTLRPDKVEKFIAYLNSEIDSCLKERGEHVIAGRNELAMHTKIRANQTDAIRSEFLRLLTEDDD